MSSLLCRSRKPLSTSHLALKALARLQEHVYAGPSFVRSCIDLIILDFLFASTGVYDDPDCRLYDVDHGVVIVGYGTTEAGKNYWIIKNRRVHISAEQ